MVSELQAAHVGMLTLSKQNSAAFFSNGLCASWLKNGIGSSCVLKLHISCFPAQSDALALNEMILENTREVEMNTKEDNAM